MASSLSTSQSSRSDTLARVYGHPGSLYSKCGGVFGTASFVDRCMEKWMQDDVLNANQAVTTWHQKAQRCGFKFLVVQIVSNLTGGPQVYTGRPMDHAHKHLNISPNEWGRFMELFNEVCNEFGLSLDIIDDLNALMISMEDDCVTEPGDRVPRDPGPQRPGGSSLYARVGGVYPLALFADRLVDALLEDERIHIPSDSQKRNEAALKYLFTELVCNICGGPEVVTARDHDETKLFMPVNEWRVVIATAQVAADHLPMATRANLVQLLEKSKDLIVDRVAQGDALTALPVAAQVKDVRAAAAGKMLSKETIAARHAAPGALVAARKRVFGDPRTLYGRGGGVFGLAKLADRLMEVWMANPILNTNEKVARWHSSQQKCGFKFLVTQIMGYLTGGPQRYTGRPMDESHKHLCICSNEWKVFMADATRVFKDDFKLDSNTTKELSEILQNYEQACVLQPGETASADPGLKKPTGAGSSLYKRLGGVYPIAEFVNKLVDDVLRGDRVRVQFDDTDDLSKRHPAGLKYMLTELVCNATGGPEVVTAKGFDEAKLGITVDEWPTFLTLVAEAAEFWPLQALRNSIVSNFSDMKCHICVGVIEDDATDDLAVARRRIQDAGFDNYLASAALEKCRGNADAALELLARGWSPNDEARSEATSTVEDGFDPDGPRCPFGFSGGSPPPGHPPMTSTRVAPTVDERLANAAKALAEQSMPATQIAAVLGLDEAAVALILGGAAEANRGRRVLGSELQKQLDDLMEEDSDLCCPVSLMLFVDPVVGSDGFLYEKASYKGLLQNRMVSPMTRERLKTDFLPARQRKSAAMDFRETRSVELLKFAEDVLASEPNMAKEALQRCSEYLEVSTPAKVPGVAKQAADLWRRLGQPLPTTLDGF